jgi:hypothetical protein
MEAFLMSYEIPIRLGFFFGIFLIMATWEMAAPRRVLQHSKWVRWGNNLGLVFLNSFILRHLAAARDGPRRPAAVAAAPGAPRRPRLRRHHGPALPSARDPALRSIKLAVIVVLGPPVLAVVAFEVLLNATSMFNHGNVRLPAGRGPRAALDRGDAGHASRAPLGAPPRDQQQLRLQPALVGSPARHLPRPAARRPRRA